MFIPVQYLQRSKLAYAFYQDSLYSAYLPTQQVGSTLSQSQDGFVVLCFRLLFAMHFQPAVRPSLKDNRHLALVPLFYVAFVWPRFLLLPDFLTENKTPAKPVRGWPETGQAVIVVAVAVVVVKARVSFRQNYCTLFTVR